MKSKFLVLDLLISKLENELGLKADENFDTSIAKTKE